MRANICFSMFSQALLKGADVYGDPSAVKGLVDGKGNHEHSRGQLAAPAISVCSSKIWHVSTQNCKIGSMYCMQCTCHMLDLEHKMCCAAAAAAADAIEFEQLAKAFAKPSQVGTGLGPCVSQPCRKCMHCRAC
jgi:hypothetical protein